MKNEVRFTIKKLNKEKLIKEITKICEVNKVEQNDATIQFKVKKRMEKKVEKLLKNKNVNILNKENCGVFHFIKSTILRLGVITAVILFCMFVLICNNFIFKTEILGLNLISKQEVIDILKNNGIVNATLKSNVDLNKLENELQKMDKVSLVSCIIRGNTLVINIKEKVYNDEYENKGDFVALCSEFDGIITELTVIQGTSLVKVGQTVKRGQPLVSPYISNTKGETICVKPMADIKADVFYNTITTISENQIIYEDTENVIEYREMSLFGQIIYSNKTQCNFKYYRTEQTKEMIGVGGVIPIIYVKIKYIEQKQIVVENFYTKNKDKILVECKQKTNKLLKSYDDIKEEYYNISENSGIVTISYTILVNKSVVKI